MVSRRNTLHLIRILQVGKYYPPYRGGMETHLADLCRTIKDRVDLRVLVAHTEKETQSERIEDVPVIRLGTPWKLFSNPICPSLQWEIRRAKVDVIHCHWPNPMALAAIMASGNPAKLVITYHSDIVKQKVLGMWLQPLFDWAARRATIIATSPDYVESSRTLSRHRDRCLVIPLGIEPKPFLNPPDHLVRGYRERFRQRVILASGRHVYYKGFQYLIEAMKEIRGHLVLSGDGPLTDSLRKMAAEAGLLERITFLGNVTDEELRALYAICDVFAFPSVARSEAFGLVQLEAMAAGKPVVNTSIASGVPFVSRHEETGITVPPSDPAALAKALNMLLDDGRLRGFYGAAARRRVLEHFTLEKMAQKTYEAYRDILGVPAVKSAVGTTGLA